MLNGSSRILPVPVGNSNPDIMVMQTAEIRLRGDVAEALNRAKYSSVLVHNLPKADSIATRASCL